MLRSMSAGPLSLAFCALAALSGCAEQEAAPRALFVVSNIEQIPAPWGGERSSGVWFSELVHPYWELTDAGFTIDLASPDGGYSAIDAFSVKLDFERFLESGGTDPGAGDPDNDRFLAEPETSALLQLEELTLEDGTPFTRYGFGDTLRLSEASAEDYDLVFYVGGNAAPYQFVDDPSVHGFATEMYDAGKLVSAVCHGTAALLNAERTDGGYLVEGRSVTGFSTAEEEALGQREVMPVLLEEEFPLRGAEYSAGTPFSEHVVVDGQLITGQQPASGRGVGREIVRYFAD